MLNVYVPTARHTARTQKGFPMGDAHLTWRAGARIPLARRLVMALCAAALAIACLPQGALAADGTASGVIQILHVNDTHGHYELTHYADEDDEEGTPVNAYAVLAGLMSDASSTVVLDAGDTFHGDSFATVSEGASIAELLDAANVAATTPGNHDWSYGADRLAELDADHDFAVLAANVVDADTGAPFFEQQYQLVDLEVTGEQLTVGIVGVIDESFYTSTPAANVEGLAFTEPVDAAVDAAEAARAAGADIVVCLTHSTDPQGFASHVSSIDAVVAGHEHVLIDEVVTAADGREVPVVEEPSSPSGEYFGSIGVLALAVSENADGTWSVAGSESEQIDTAGQYALADEGVEALTDELAARNAEILDEVVGTSSTEYAYSTTELPGGWERIRTEDMPIGHVVTGSYLALTGADLAFENAGGIRGGVPAGDVTAGDLISISPYGNTLATYELTGADILATIEHSLSISKACRDVLAAQIEALESGEDPMQYSWPSNSGSVLVVGGATMEIDWDAADGERIVSIEMADGGAFDPDATYTVAMNSYLPGATDEYPAFATMRLAQEWGSCEQALRALVADASWEQQVDDLTGTITYTERVFPDADPTAWYYEAVVWAAENGVFHGYDDGTFGVDDPLAREQAAAVLYNYLGGEPGAPDSGLADVADEWYTDAVNWTVAHGVMTGYEGTNLFGVGEALTREQFCSVIAKATGADLTHVDETVLDEFADAESVSDWARPAVAWAIQQGIINGVEHDGIRTLEGARGATRVEMAALMKNAVDAGVLQA